MCCGEFKYYKNGNRSQKPEKCNYGCRDAASVVSKELESHLDYTNDFIINRFCALTNTATTMVVGADQGQGAW